MFSTSNNMDKWHFYNHLCSATQSCLTLCDLTEAHQASPSFTISWSFLKLMPTELMML